MAYPRNDELFGSPGGCGGSPENGSARIRNSSGETTGSTCSNPMAPPSRAFCSWARSRLIDAAILSDLSRSAQY